MALLWLGVGGFDGKVVRGLQVLCPALDALGTVAVLLVPVVLGLALMVLFVLVILEGIDSAVLAELWTVLEACVLCHFLALLGRPGSLVPS